MTRIGKSDSRSEICPRCLVSNYMRLLFIVKDWV